MSLKRWDRVSRKLVIENRYWSYYLDEFRTGDGYTGEYHYVHTLGSTIIIPVKENKNLLLVRQFRYLNQKESIEFPCGGVEKGLTRKENALKELREESGYSAGVLQEIGEFSPYTGAGDEICTVFLARHLEYSPLPKDHTEEFELLEMSPAELSEMIDKNIIWDGLTLSAWALARKYLEL